MDRGLRFVGRSIARALASPPVPVAGTHAPIHRRVAGTMRRVAVTTARAAAAAVGAVAVGIVVSGLTTLAVLPAATDAERAVRQSLAGWLAGGAALAAVVWARAVARRRLDPVARPSVPLARLLGEPIIGWTAGWIVASTLVVAVLVASPSWVGSGQAAAGIAPAMANGAVGAAAIAWAVGWTVFGAVAGAWGVGDDAPAPARTAALFAAIGYLVARGAMALLAGGQ